MNNLTFVHRFAPGKEGSARTLLLLHGTGGNENDLLELAHALDPNAAVLSPRGKVLENGAPRFFRRLAEGVFDEADVIERARELADFVAAAVIHYKINFSNLVAVGYSNGANIATAMILLGVATFPRAILFRPMIPLSHFDLNRLRARHTQILILAGEWDPIAEPPIAKKLAELLTVGEQDVALVVQPGVGHELTANDVSAARQWLASQR